MNWKIIYSDGSSFSDEDGGPEQAPGWGVQFILQKDNTVGVEVLHSVDNYIWKDNQWFAVDTWGFSNYLMQPGFKITKFGEYIPNDKYREMFKMAFTDKDLPKKSATYRHERGTE